MWELAENVTKGLEHMKVPLRVAVMGCVVNGPGEAREADLGVASGNGKGQIFVKGEVIKTVPEDQIVETLIEEATRIAAEMEASGEYVPEGSPAVSVSCCWKRRRPGEGAPRFSGDVRYVWLWWWQAWCLPLPVVAAGSDCLFGARPVFSLIFVALSITNRSCSLFFLAAVANRARRAAVSSAAVSSMDSFPMPDRVKEHVFALDARWCDELEEVLFSDPVPNLYSIEHYLACPLPVRSPRIPLHYYQGFVGCERDGQLCCVLLLARMWCRCGCAVSLLNMLSKVRTLMGLKRRMPRPGHSCPGYYGAGCYGARTP